jgi:uncharacterized RDD family membrane protein YckC
MRSSRQDVSGNYAGAVTRLLAYWVDLSVAGIIFVTGSAALNYVLQAIVGVDTVTQDAGVWYAAAAIVWLFVYWWVSVAIAGKTPGKALLGLRVVTRDGASLSSSRAALRAIAFPLNYVLFGIGFLGILVGRERRALHDFVAGSAVVYDWGPRTAELPLPISAYLAKRSADEASPAKDASGEDVVESDS